MNRQFVAKFSWRWVPTPEQKFLEELKGRQSPASRCASSQAQPRQKSASNRATGRVFAGRSAIAACRASIRTDWQQSPPKELSPATGIGPGWASFCVVGDRLFTQEQLAADDEYVRLLRRDDRKRSVGPPSTQQFEEMVAGPGPRATPTFHAGPDCMPTGPIAT